MPKLNYGRAGGYGLSYSRGEELKTCPRKFELNNIIGLGKNVETVTFSFGHFVGAGIQGYYELGDFKRTIATCIQHWGVPFDDEGTFKEQRAKKNFWTAIEAVENFFMEIENPMSDLHKYTKGYELAYFDLGGKKARNGIELYFSVECFEGYSYEGHIDVVLYNKEKDEYMVVELKTTSLTNVHPAMYQNSNQALSYSVVIDEVAGGFNANSSYSVLYVVYCTSKKEFVVFKFNKSVLQRSHWINSLIFDINIIEMYRESGLEFPKNGASCFNFFSPCEYLDTCNYTNASLQRLAKRNTEEDKAYDEDHEFDFTTTIESLIERQEKLQESRIGTIEADFDSSGNMVDVSDLLNVGD